MTHDVLASRSGARRRRRARGARGGAVVRAFSMAEVVVCSAIVGLMLVAALNTVGSAAAAQQSRGVRQRGRMLAEALLSEALQKAYQDASAVPTFGPEAGEVTGNRSAFDDVDDYEAWTESPPAEAGGAALPGFTGWVRQAKVVWADPSDVSRTVYYETKIKRVTVTTRYNGNEVASVTSLLADVPHNPEDPSQ